MDYKEKYEQGLECIQEILSGAGESIKASILRKRFIMKKIKLNEETIKKLKEALDVFMVNPKKGNEMLDKIHEEQQHDAKEFYCEYRDCRVTYDKTCKNCIGSSIDENGNFYCPYYKK